MNCTIYSFDSQFDANQAINYRLGISIHPGGFSFGCLDLSSNKVIGFADYRMVDPLPGTGRISPLHYINLLKQTFTTVDLFKQPFHDIRIANAGLVHSLVPEMLVNDLMAEKLISFNFVIDSDEVIMVDKIDILDACNLYVCHNSFMELMNTLKGDIRIRATSSVFIENILTIPVPRNSITPFFLNFSGNIVDIAWVNKSTVEYCNSFFVTTPEDILYYILFVVEQLNFDTETVELTLSGDVRKDSAEVSLLKKYFSHISFTDLPGTIGYSPEIDKSEEQRNYILFNLLA